MPPEVEAAIDKRSSMSAIGNLNDYVKYQMAQGLAQPGGGGGVAGSAAEVAMGFAMAQQMMQGMAAGSPASGGAFAAPAAGAPTAAIPELLGPADAAKLMGVSEADVIATIESGELKAKKIGSQFRITRAALDAFLNS